MIKVDLGLNKNQELNLLQSYNILRNHGIQPNFELLNQTRPLRFRFQGHYFNVFHTGKINVFVNGRLSDKRFEIIFKELQDLIFKKSVVSTMVDK